MWEASILSNTTVIEWLLCCPVLCFMMGMHGLYPQWAHSPVAETDARQADDTSIRPHCVWSKCSVPWKKVPEHRLGSQGKLLRVWHFSEGEECTKLRCFFDLWKLSIKVKCILVLLTSWVGRLNSFILKTVESKKVSRRRQTPSKCRHWSWSLVIWYCPWCVLCVSNCVLSLKVNTQYYYPRLSWIFIAHGHSLKTKNVTYTSCITWRKHKYYTYNIHIGHFSLNNGDTSWEKHW